MIRKYFVHYKYPFLFSLDVSLFVYKYIFNSFKGTIPANSKWSLCMVIGCFVAAFWFSLFLVQAPQNLFLLLLLPLLSMERLQPWSPRLRSSRLPLSKAVALVSRFLHRPSPPSYKTPKHLTPTLVPRYHQINRVGFFFLLHLFHQRLSHAHFVDQFNAQVI